MRMLQGRSLPGEPIPSASEPVTTPARHAGRPGATPGLTTTRVWCQTVGDSARNGDYAGASPVTLTIFAVSSNSRTTGFDPVDGGASPPAAAIRGLGLRSVVVSLAGRNSGGCDSRRLHHFHGSQALTVMPPVLTRQNPEHYRGGPPWLGGAAVSAAPS